MANLFLHIGLPVTGVTYIQGILQMSSDGLYETGLIQPNGNGIHAPEFPLYADARINEIFESRRWMDGVFQSMSRSDSCGAIVSSKHLWKDFKKPRLQRMLQGYRNDRGFERIRILVFVRNPIEMAVTLWMQSVKLDGGTQELDDFLKGPNPLTEVYSNVSGLLEWLSEVAQVELSVYNYSVTRNELMPQLAHWLEVPAERLRKPEIKRIWRVMDRGETRLQLELNRILGKGARFLATTMAERITEGEPWSPAPSTSIQESIWKGNEPWIERINRFLPEGHEMVFDRMEPKDAEQDCSFKESQLSLIAEILGGEIKRHWDRETLPVSLMRSLKLRFGRKGG